MTPIEDEAMEEIDLDEAAPTPASVRTPTVPPASSPRTAPAPTAAEPPAPNPAEPSVRDRVVEAPTPITADRAVSAEGRALYDEGYALFHRQRYVDAESAFRRFLLDHGDTELADNAGYWIGEARFARGDYQGALAAFSEAAERYPKGNKVPDLLLKAGRCLEELGDVETARARYGEIIRRFPGTAASAVAEDRRAELP